MASKSAVGAALTVLARAFAGAVSPEKIDLYAAALEDVSDGDLERAVVRLVKEHTGEFIPNPATVRRAAGANVAPVVDVEAIVTKIERLSTYGSQAGTRPPRVETVRQALGDAIGAAYATVGHRLLSGNLTTAEIAVRDFAKELEAQVDARGPQSLLPTPDAPRLTAGRDSAWIPAAESTKPRRVGDVLRTMTLPAPEPSRE